MKVRKRVCPKSLYPMITIESIDPNILNNVVKEIKNGIEIGPIKVVDFKGYYFIWEGNYEMLASNIVGKTSIEIEVISLDERKNWVSDENMETQLKAVGKNALYDFEALGGFHYSEYPAFYN